MKRIEKLTEEQRARFPEFVKKWTDIGLCTLPADRLKAEHGIRLAYDTANLKAPKKIVWTTSPLAQGLTRAIVLEATKGKVGKALGNNVRVSLWNSVASRVEDSVWNSVWDSVRARVEDSLGNSVVGDSVKARVGDSVKDSVWDRVRDSVRDSVWTSVWTSVGTSVGARVGARVGDSVRDSVWTSVWTSVGDSVGDSVRDSVGESGYGQHDAGWLSFYDFFKRVCALEEQTAKLRGIWEIAESAGWYLPHEHLCWISERPRRVCLNARGRLHSHDRMAVEYPDGWGLWAWNGVRVTEQIILRPATVTPEQIAKESNAQVRQVMVERIGIERVCQMFQAQRIDKQGTYELLILNLRDGRKRPYLKMLNPSMGVWHVEGVAPHITTVQAALNFRNGLTDDQIDDVNGADWYEQGDVILKPKGAVKFKSKPTILT